MLIRKTFSSKKQTNKQKKNKQKTCRVGGAVSPATLSPPDLNRVKAEILQNIFRSSPSEVFLGKGVLKICSKFTVQPPCRTAISIKLLCHLYILRKPFPKNAC